MNGTDNKKIYIGIGALLFLIFVFFIVRMFTSSKKEINNRQNQNPTPSIQLPITTESLSATENQKIVGVKEKIKNTYVFESITLDYAPKSDTLIIYHAIARDEAETQLNTFLNREGVTNSTNIKKRYIDLNAQPPEKQY